MAKRETYTAAAFTKNMDAFISYCECEGIDATDYQLIKFFGISPAAFERYRSANKMNSDSIHNAESYRMSFKKLELYREDATIRQIVSDSKLTSHGAFKLKQPHWGGWSDKQDAASDVTVRMKIGDGDSTLLD